MLVPMVETFVIQPPLGVKAPPVNGTLAAGQLMFKSSAAQPGSMPCTPDCTHALDPTEPLAPTEMMLVPGPVLAWPMILAFPTSRELIAVSSVTTPPLSLRFAGSYRPPVL